MTLSHMCETLEILLKYTASAPDWSIGYEVLYLPLPPEISPDDLSRLELIGVRVNDEFDCLEVCA